jgi:hypothetical protein
MPWETKGFAEHVRKVVTRESGYGKEETRDALKGNWKIIPDAFFVDEERSLVFILEIVEANDIDENKAVRLSNLSWLLDMAGYAADVVQFYPESGSTFVVNTFGLDWTASTLKGRKFPHRDAFKTAKQQVTDGIFINGERYVVSVTA